MLVYAAIPELNERRQSGPPIFIQARERKGALPGDFVTLVYDGPLLPRRRHRRCATPHSHSPGHAQ